MADPFKLTRIGSLRSIDDFRRHVDSLGIIIPAEDAIATSDSPLLLPAARLSIHGKIPGNRWVIHPMEGWDGTVTGGVTDEVRRRWCRFGESGAKIIFGGEAMAVRADGRANPHQLILDQRNLAGLRDLLALLRSTHREHHGTTEDLIVGFQLTHSGRFCRPVDKLRWEPRVAFRHPLIDARFQVTSDDQVFSDDELGELVGAFISAARLAAEAGADFVDIKHCHGYLLHELLGAHTRPGRYGGSFENRTRFLREVIEGIRADGNPIDLAVRLSAFDFVPFRPDPARSQPGRPGPGIPEAYSHLLPYRYAFGIDARNPVQHDLTETLQFADLCTSLGVSLLNLTAGSPYYNPHIQRPAAYPPSDGYQPAHDPLIDVARQLDVVRQVRSHLAGRGPLVIGSGYSYLQEFLPHVAQATIRQGWTDLIGLGRMVLSYPRVFLDATSRGTLTPRLLCRTFSDCTTAPRNGLVSGCYPLDEYYKERPEAGRLREIKKGG